MKASRTLLIAAGLLLSVNAIAIQPSSAWKLSPNSLGPIQIGMSLSEVQRVTHQKLISTKPDKYQAEDESCFYSHFRNLSLAGISLMVSYGKVVRIDITSKEYSTTKGIRLGDEESQVKQAYPGILVSQHRYDQKGHYLTYPPKLTTRGIRFETSEGKVTLMYAGEAREIQYVEACV